MQQDEYARMYALENSFWWYVGLRKLLEQHLMQYAQSASTALRILDAGCGTGANLQMLSRYGLPCGIDLSPAALEFSRKRNLQNLCAGSMMSLPYRDNTFDVVLSADVLYHQWIDDDVAALHELRRITKSNGLLLLHVAALEMLRGSHDRVVLTRKRYRLGEVARLLNDTGFRVESSTYRNSILFPALLMKRLFESRRAASSDLAMPSPVVNSLLTQVMIAENALLRYVPFPFGSSIFAVARAC
jgi:ubiquinone/menaquinone biosynthesis C-methylase UbiE